VKEPIELARGFAERALMERLPRTPAEKRDKLLQRIAGVRAGIADTAPEVVSARLAVEWARMH